MVYTDPYTPTEAETRYECTECLGRTTGDAPGECPDCGGTVRNLSVPRW